MQAHLDEGAQVVQARYGVLDAMGGWRTRLMELALALFHDVRSRGRQNLRLSCGLRGNGMCFTRNILLQVPLQSTSLVEDVEQGIILGCAGIVVHHARETTVLGEMPRGGAAATTQRIRWERGRSQLTRTWLARLCREAWREKDVVLADLAADLALPPLTTLALIIGGGWLAAVLLVVLGGGYGALILWSAAAALMTLYVARGVALSQRGWRAWGDLAAAPFFVAWKVLLLVRNRAVAAPSWVRTTRVGEKP
jgi:cellulose synthase/poly-beta-1,6-N-acetylglucosamine synthase-like glycosyltransferase